MSKMGRPPRQSIPAELAYGLAWNESERSGVDFVKLMGQCREDDVARARWRVFAQLHAAGHSLPQIADVWGMDHTSVLHGLRELKNPTSKRATRDKQICDLYDTGLSLVEVGRRFEITRERVRQILVKSGNYDRHFGAEARARQEEYRKGIEERKAYRAARKAKIIELYHQGLTYKQIALEMGYANGHLARVIEVVRDAGIANRHPSTIGKKKRLTDEQKQQICERYAAGDDYREIAKAFDIMPSSVSVVANNNGYHRPRREPKPPKQPTPDRPDFVAPALVGYSNRRSWTDEEVRRVEELSAAGKSASEIASEIGRSRNAIIGLWGRARRNGAGTVVTPP